jgi:hypothetical protein
LSVLTKVAVVLHVILSLVLTSGVIVFVNKIEPLEKKVVAANDAASRERTGRLAAEQELAAVSGNLNLRVAEADFRAAALRTAFDAADKKTRDAVAVGNAAEQGKQKAEAERDTANAAAQGALATIDAQQKVINDVSTRLATSQKEGAESQTRIAGLIKELDGTKYTLRRVREENEALSQKLDAGGLPSRPGVQGGVSSADGTSGGASGGSEAFVNLRGVVKGKRNINGTEYATISIGSAQRVQKGMQFKVIDGGNFLGYLTVDTVDSDESTGHLSGPSLTQVRQGTQVRTQW